jgi:azurin
VTERSTDAIETPPRRLVIVALDADGVDAALDRALAERAAQVVRHTLVIGGGRIGDARGLVLEGVTLADFLASMGASVGVR